MGADISYWDPYVDQWTVNEESIPRVTDLSRAINRGDFDAVLLLQRHQQLDIAELEASGIPVLDTRAVLHEQEAVERL